MFRTLLTSLFIGTFAYLITSIKGRNSSIEGDWKIETVIYEGDTLYQFGSRSYTVDAYNRITQGWEKSKDDTDYLMKCLGSTIYGFQSVRLTISENHFDQTTINPCWDHIRFPRVDEGKYTSLNDALTLLDGSNQLLMTLRYDTNLDCLFYASDTWNYQFVYSRANKK